MKYAPLIFFLTLPIVVWGRNLESVVDFDLELSSLADPAVSEAAERAGRIVILEGLMGDTFIDTEIPGGGVWVNLVEGAWIGTDEVRAYSCRILFRGDSWGDVFAENGFEESGAAYIEPGTRLLVAARVTGWDRKAERPTAEMMDFRVLN